MSDEEVVRALLMLARKLGVENRLVVAIQHGIGDRETAARDDALCLAFGKYRETRLLCTYAKGHDRACSWVGAMIGKSACIARTPGTLDANLLCQLPTHHAGEHKAHGADGVRWTWGDAPTVVTPSERHRCGAQEWGTNGHRMSCVLRAGHEGAHRGVDADGKSMVTWPCPCYPDCTGHTATGDVDWSAVRLTSDSPELRCGARRASENPVMAGQVCELLRGHEGSHEATVNGQRWVFGAHEPRTMLMCDAKSRGESHDTAGRTCQLMTGHDGPHGARGAFGLMVSWMPDDPTEPRA